jgi:uncharacterized SAM-binding protein YcdF (DUF218 family)
LPSRRRRLIFLPSMNLTKRFRLAFLGLLLGALAGFILGEMGVADVLRGLGVQELVLVGAAVGAVAAALGGMPTLAGFDGLLMVAYGLAAWTPIVNALARGQVRADPVPQQLDGVVVLSSGVLSNGALDVHGVDRILTGIELLNHGIARRVVTTRVRASYSNGELTSDDDQHRLIALATTLPRWDVVDSVHSTRDEATRIARLLIPQGARRIAVVTSPMHTRRACATFEKLGFTVTCVPAREHAAVTAVPESAHDRLAALREYVYESLATAKYRAKGWIS